MDCPKCHTKTRKNVVTGQLDSTQNLPWKQLGIAQVATKILIGSKKAACSKMLQMP
jgi:hypothetical protein